MINKLTKYGQIEQFHNAFTPNSSLKYFVLSLNIRFIVVLYEYSTQAGHYFYLFGGYHFMRCQRCSHWFYRVKMKKSTAKAQKRIPIPLEIAVTRRIGQLKNVSKEVIG